MLRGASNGSRFFTACFALGLVLLVTTGAAVGNIARTDTAIIQDEIRMELHAVQSYTGTNAKNERIAADTDASQLVDASEAAAYEVGAAATRRNNQTVALRWDGNPTYWIEVTATTQGYEGSVNNNPCSLLLDGLVNLTSIPGENHTLTVAPPSTFSSYEVSLSFPSNWSLVDVTGLNVASRTNTSVSGTVSASVAIIQVRSTPLVPPTEDRTAPTIDLGADRGVVAGAVGEFNATVVDNDPLFPANASFWWTFDYNGSQFNISGANFSYIFWSLGTYTLTFTAIDGSGNRADLALHLRVVSPDQEPPSVSAVVEEQVQAGTVVNFTGAATDNDPSFPGGALFWWTFEYRQTLVNLSGLNVSFRFDEPGTYEATLWVRDGWGNIANSTRTVVVTPAGPSPGANGTPPAISVFAPELLVGVSALGLLLAALGGLAIYRRRGSGVVAPGEVTTPEAGAEAPMAPAPARQAFVVEGVLILYKDGRLIHHQAAGKEAMFESPEVIGAMFTAVAEFIRDSFREEGSLSRLTSGQNTILIERSRDLFGATIVFGEPDVGLQDALLETLRRLESAYAGVVERWNGERDAFVGIERFVAPLLAATAGLTRADVRAAITDKVVKLVSATEHYKGYIRLRVAFVNDSEEKITNAVLAVDINLRVLRLARVEPAALKRDGLTVELGDVGPGERVGAMYYLDPQTCSETNIEGRATYRDSSQVERIVAMKPRTAEIICPVFFTPHHANAATMRRLVETSLAARDSKVYRVLTIPTETSYRDLFNVAREAVQRHHVVLVRNLLTASPFYGKAWFYGQTKLSKSPVIIRASASEERRAIEFFVAADSPSILTGLLAEFHRSFSEMLNQRLPAVTIEPVLDDRLKGLMGPDEFGSSPPGP